jgi:hypothetical protein
MAGITVMILPLGLVGVALQHCPHDPACGFWVSSRRRRAQGSLDRDRLLGAVGRSIYQVLNLTVYY